MGELIRSTAAIGSMPDFFPDTVLIWVEGESDKIFYEILLRSIGQTGFKIKFAGGKNAIKDYAEKLLSEDGNFCVVIDSDYDRFINTDFTRYKSAKLVRTDGHSLENMLYSPKVVEMIIYLKSRQLGEYAGKFDEWRRTNFECFEELIVLDMLNEVNSMGLKIIDRNYDQFTKSRGDCEVCPDKVKKRTEDLQASHSFKHKNKISKRLKGPRHKVIRGHFYEKGVKSYIIKMSSEICSKRIYLTDDEMFEKALAIIEADPNRLDSLKYLKTRIVRAMHIVTSSL